MSKSKKAKAQQGQRVLQHEQTGDKKDEADKFDTRVQAMNERVLMNVLTKTSQIKHAGPSLLLSDLS